MVVEFFVSLLPPERHNYTLIHERCVSHDPRLFIPALEKRGGQRPDFLFHDFLELASTVVRLDPSLLDVVGVYQPWQRSDSLCA